MACRAGARAVRLRRLRAGRRGADARRGGADRQRGLAGTARRSRPPPCPRPRRTARGRRPARPETEPAAAPQGTAEDAPARAAFEVTEPLQSSPMAQPLLRTVSLRAIDWGRGVRRRCVRDGLLSDGAGLFGPDAHAPLALGRGGRSAHPPARPPSGPVVAAGEPEHERVFPQRHGAARREQAQGFCVAEKSPRLCAADAGAAARRVRGGAVQRRARRGGAGRARDADAAALCGRVRALCGDEPFPPRGGRLRPATGSWRTGASRGASCCRSGPCRSACGRPPPGSPPPRRPPPRRSRWR